MFRFASYRGCARVLLASAGALSLVHAASAQAFGFEDITQWVGTGDQQAALVIDWANGSPAEVWGYRWTGAGTTAQDMFDAVFAADTRLFNAPLSTPGHGGPGTIYGLGFDADSDGFTYVPGLGDTGSAADSDDYYAEGWNVAGFWGYFVNEENSEFNFVFNPDTGTFDPVANPNFGTQYGNPYDDGQWVSSGLGLEFQVLTDGDWNGLAFAPGFVGSDPGQPVPEPGSAVLLALAGAALMRRRRG